VPNRIMKIVGKAMVVAAVTAMAAGCGVPETMNRQPKPTSFRHHAFSAKCANTRSCRVLYAGRFQIDEPDGGRVLPNIDDVIASVRHAQIGIHNFPGPVVVSWQTLDGTVREASVDLSKIFKSRVVLHAEPVHEVDDDGVHGEPTILVVVNDRTVQVYMQSMVYLRKAMPDDGKPYKTRHDSVLAYSESY
jgi:hypothetical protein